MKKTLSIILLLIVGYSQKPVDETILIDIDGNSYKTVKIGNQIWMAENLKVTHYQNGAPISNNDGWSETYKGVYCVYPKDDDDASTETCKDNCAGVYGNLYNWHAVNDERGLAPKGWHIPTLDEWKELEKLLSGDGGKLKSRGTKDDKDGLWKKPNEGATNESGFTALPSGYRYHNGDYKHMGNSGTFWSSTEHSSSYAWYWKLYYADTKMNWHYRLKQNGYSIRCVMD